MTTPTRQKRKPGTPFERRFFDAYRAQLSWPRIDAALAKLDRHVSAIERAWGIDRLPLLVDGALRERFEAQLARLDAAIEEIDGEAVERHAAATMRAWDALVDAATAVGHAPLGVDGVLECAMPDGRIMIVGETAQQAARAGQDRAGCVCMGIDEVARVMALYDPLKAVAVAKHLWPGAQMREVRTRGGLDDELPF
jgi:hypothetical protein